MAFVGFWMIPLVLILSIFSPIIGFFETITGKGQEEIVLPYDVEKGIVWEYNEGDYSFVDCIKTEIKDGQQIFTFRGKGIGQEGRPKPADYNSDQLIDDICFEDENGNTKTYYAFVDFAAPLNEGGTYMYGDLDIYEETECVTFEYTVKAKEETENAYWYVDDFSAEIRQNRYIGEEELINVHERTYKFIFAPEDVENHTFTMYFFYKPSSTHVLERIEVLFELADKEVTVINEKYS